WTIGNLAVGGSVAMEFVVTVDDIGIFTNVAEVTAANEEDSDSVPGDGEGDDWDDAVVTAIAIDEASSEIGDYVWYDKDDDEVQDADELPVVGAIVRITNQATSVTSTQTTNDDGKYLFAGLDAGTYVVEILTSSLPDNHALTTVGTYTVTVLDDESFLDADFGIIEILPVTGMEIETAVLIGLLFLGLGGALLGYESGRRRLTNGVVAA
ncbi:MAG: SdrD B-like domain-containing protein, partial [Acidimicrobiia bacterium]|nr:SdrD B-like domain-containing protein [Acidimicrobiia bacterium]MDX2468199.1 SdrD B-like domain-containing protein [Acidimicrobiia bacterium]